MHITSERLCPLSGENTTVLLRDLFLDVPQACLETPNGVHLLACESKTLPAWLNSICGPLATCAPTGVMSTPVCKCEDHVSYPPTPYAPYAGVLTNDEVMERVTSIGQCVAPQSELSLSESFTLVQESEA